MPTQESTGEAVVISLYLESPRKQMHDMPKRMSPGRLT